MQRILIQLDTDPQPSTFDRIVAVDAGADEVFGYGGISTENVEPLVHGAMFTRGPDDLKNTAIFIGGSDVRAGEALMQKVAGTFFGPLRVSVMMDSGGSNTTAAAAVLVARKHLELAGTEALVLGGTGPVGHRAAQLLASEGCRVRVASRSLDRAQTVCREITEKIETAQVTPYQISTEADCEKACCNVELIIAAGAAGVQLLSAEVRRRQKSLRVALDLNAVPPAGVEGIEPTDKATEHDGVICYGAIGIGGYKMKIHKAALARLFEANDLVLDTDAIYRLGTELL